MNYDGKIPMRGFFSSHNSWGSPRRRGGGGANLAWLVATVLVLAGVFGLECCRGMLVDEREALGAVEALGMSRARVVSRSNFFANLLGCSASDAAEFDVEATNSAGKVVTMTVCVGWPFKGATVRH